MTKTKKNKEKKQKRIMVVDDSLIARNSVAKELINKGFEVFFAGNGKEAIEKAKEEKPDLITMDVNMPVLDGYQACYHLKREKITKSIPIVILTNNNTRDEREKGFKVGAVEYFTKPFDQGVLSAHISNLLLGTRPPRVEKILIAEDSVICRSIYEAMLKKHGFEFTSVENGNQVFEKLDEGFEPSIILLDRNMPVLDGFKTCQRLKKDKNYRHIPVVMVTVAKEKEDIILGLKSGANDYITKPFDEDELLARIETHIKNFSLFRKLQNQYNQLDLVTEELNITNKKLEELALIDPLTEILNRRGFEKGLKEQTKKIQRTGSELMAVLIDLDNFKGINDEFGHSAGDIVLKEIVIKLKNSLRPLDYLARIGGDEFLVLLTDTNLVEGMKTAERIRLSVSGTPIALPSRSLHVTASLGVAKVDRTSLSVDELLAQTHTALRIGKESGKNNVIYSDDKVDLSKTHLPAMTEALQNLESYRCVKQPIFEIQGEKLVGYELLSRGPAGMFEDPNYFFRFSIEKKCLTRVDHLCLQTCFKKASSMDFKGTFHINLFPSTLIEFSTSQLLDLFQETKKDIKNFCLEISDKQIVGYPSYLRKSVDAIKDAGMLIALDDVGFGRSSLESLIILEPNFVKIDRICISEIASNPEKNRSLVRLMKAVEALGSQVIAEGVESRDDLNVLKDLGVPYCQGFLLGKPE